MLFFQPGGEGPRSEAAAVRNNKGNDFIIETKEERKQFSVRTLKQKFASVEQQSHTIDTVFYSHVERLRSIPPITGLKAGLCVNWGRGCHKRGGLLL